ncbi:NAD-dependent deacetylase [Inquilinus ginsengisoli]|uniref:NAD-dependent protein deacylase n=1 Tax=Inquilinus ginsengisoli TaxID=363840 RepID=A0ABU1JZM1_9PROT|nr:NAD-dependent deacylase [Inquilinus ginsengisoli]MDR6293474.1 NAD-dependent deacetylase [Inquilinus ginsengisoli]
MQRIQPGDPIVILTGAGISKESGLDTFRDTGGVWTRVRLEDVATPDAFDRDPDLVHGFYNARRRTLADPAIQPNPAHAALVRLERDWPGPVLLVTQNVDDLHERAGSRGLIHMHGQLARARCLACGAGRDWAGDLSVDTPCPACGATGGMRPDVVWFGEMPLAMAKIEAALAACRLFVSIGTSGTVYPAAAFVHQALDAGALTVELNLEPGQASGLFAIRRRGPATQLVPKFVERLLAGEFPGR